MDLWLAPHDFRVRSLRKLGYGVTPTPFGDCLALASNTHLLALRFAENRFDTLAQLQNEWPKATLHSSAETALLVPKAFENPSNIPVLAVGTPFQLTVWEFLRSIPCGTTLTYGALAKAIGKPTAARAVGQAVGANGIAVVIPCHRIVSPGRLAGYRWGLKRKQLLLASELPKTLPLSG